VSVQGGGDATNVVETDAVMPQEEVYERLVAVVAGLLANAHVSRIEGKDGFPIVVGAAGGREAGYEAKAGRAPDGVLGAIPKDGEGAAFEERVELLGRVHG
jgi:hypothetical protein